MKHSTRCTYSAFSIPDNARRGLEAHTQRVGAVGATAAVLQHEEGAAIVGVGAVDDEEQTDLAVGQQRQQLAHVCKHVRCANGRQNVQHTYKYCN